MVYVELALVLLLTVINGAFAMSELAVVSARPARLRPMAERGVAGAEKALALGADPGKFLSSVQIGITLIGILSGAVSGATLGQRLAGALGEAGLSPGLASGLGVGIVVTLITYLQLIIGELVPKQIALRDPERVACLVAPFMTGLAKVASPIVWVLDRSGKLVLKLLGQSGDEEKSITEEEVKSIVAEAESAGVLEPSERRIISSVMRLSDRQVQSVMTPRVDVDMIDLSEDFDENRKVIMGSRHSRFPAHEGDPDEIIGVIWIRDIFDETGVRTRDLRSLVREAPIIPEGLEALDAVDVLRKSTAHMGLIHDEYGNFLGVITPADVLEAIVGAFASDSDEGEEAMVLRPDGSILVSGWAPISDVAEVLNLNLPKRRGYETAAGFLIQVFGVLPKVGDRIQAEGWEFEIMDLDGRRIDKILASPLAPPSAEG
ncbi:hemolysin family protein [Neomegalonema sp.]|uniref:hemolysin family protein n=1 Tax=Neomegalonema sp. TaxID=2039713 RepID=UPI002615A494|nr:hemolysin family protein [Neomegalonema sp.]MDD2867436.1 hemolysin family protein [Neomegalonema sp.]